MTISTPYMLLCKNRFLHAAFCITPRLIKRTPTDRELIHVIPWQKEVSNLQRSPNKEGIGHKNCINLPENVLEPLYAHAWYVAVSAARAWLLKSWVQVDVTIP
jgi:hypothetical protein